MFRFLRQIDRGLRLLAILAGAGRNVLVFTTLSNDKDPYRAGLLRGPRHTAAVRRADLLVGRILSDRTAHAFLVRAGARSCHWQKVCRHPRRVRRRRHRPVANAAQLKVTDNPPPAPAAPHQQPGTAYLHCPDRWLPVLLGLLGEIATAITTRLCASEIAKTATRTTQPA
jgi:hypothetical protein